MNESSSSASSPRNGRPRGGRRRRPSGGGGGGQERDSDQRSSASNSRESSGPSAKAAKPNFFQRVLSIFTGGSAKAPAPAAARPTSRGTAGGAPNASRSGYGRVHNEENGSSRTASAPREPRESSGDRSDSSVSRDRGASRRPETVEVTTPRLYVGNLSFDTTESDLSELFNGVGRVVSAEIVTHRQTQRSKGFAFVQMAEVDEAKRAVEQLHDKDFMGRKLFLSGAKSAEPHDGRDEPRFAS